MAVTRALRKGGTAPQAIDPPATEGDDSFDLFGGAHSILAGGGADGILARRIAPSLLDGGAGDDVVHLINAAADSTVRGGADNDTLLLDYAGAGLFDGGTGNDLIRILFAAPGSTVQGGEGDDIIRVRNSGAGSFDGGAGNDVIRLINAAPGSTLLGGEGDDIIHVRSAATQVEGGAGDDRFFLDAATAGGSVIVDSDGLNRLRIATDAPLDFHREAGGSDLQIILGADGAFDPTRDIVWKDFFDSPLNRVNGLSTAKIAALAPEQGEPLPLGPTIAEMLTASEAAYSRAGTGLPDGLTVFAPGGTPLEQEVTTEGFYARALLTRTNQLIVTFEGTDIKEIDTRTEFVAAQIAADAEIYLGLTPDAFTLGVSFTQTVLAAAASAGIAAGDVFVTGHSLGAGIAMYVGAQLDMAGMTFAAPGIAAAAIPTGQASKLVNYVEYGDPVGNYSANPPVMGPFLHDDAILRYGPAEYLGDPLAAVALVLDTAIFGPGSTEAEKAAALTGLAALAATYHPLTGYAADLGFPLLGATPPDAADYAAALPIFVAAVAALGGSVPGGGALIA